MKKLFVTNYVGLASRLETLPLAFLLRDYLGHNVYLDWPDLGDFNVIGAQHKKFRLYHRFNLVKKHTFQIPEDLYYLKSKNINLRTQFGFPSNHLKKYYLSTYERIKLNPHHIYELSKLFSKYANSPIVGVHIRRGDFVLSDDQYYDATTKESLAVPNWWYLHVMGELVKWNPDIKFFVSFTGSKSHYTEIFDSFDCITFTPQKKYPDNYFGHISDGHAVCDLFALACCSVVIASPCSSFSHVAVNALGPKSTALLPLIKMNKNRPAFGKMCLWGKQARNAWYDSCRTNRNWERVQVAENVSNIKPADYGWL
jgi:hypothetical protein